jgi:hypothetical protein
MKLREATRFFERRRRERDFAVEVQAYQEEETERNLALGMDPRDAADAAHRKFGNITAIREKDREMNTSAFLKRFGRT